MGEAVAVRYRAFLSYSHADAAAAGRIHRALEFYRMPGRLVGQATTLGSTPKRLTPIFRDRDELPASDDLSAKIREALGKSDALIVLCSPAARASPWVTREIEAFRELCPGRPILAALIDGEPAEAFPEALTSAAAGAIEPVAADFRKGRDGRRLAQLKLVAGLTGVELDALVQRDAQREIRRVTTITLVALAAMLIMALLLVLAVNARREAEHQRAQAEGMVEFMLTDLRTRLKGVGRLDVMEAVNRRAIAYYGDQRALGSLSDDSLERRARILHAMGEDDVTRADYANALSRFAEAHAATAATLARHPDDPNAIFAHAQSDYWLGRVHELHRDWAPAERQYSLYAAAGRRLIALAPSNPSYMMERGWGPLNLGHVTLHGAKDGVAAEALFRDAIGWFAKAARARNDKAEALREQANAMGDLADAFVAQGRLREALGARQEEHRINLQLHQADPGNVDYVFVLAISERSVARMSRMAGVPAQIWPVLQSARDRAAWLLRREPTNADWLLLKAMIACDMLAEPSAKILAPGVSTLRGEVMAARDSFIATNNPRILDISNCIAQAEK